jgi:FtsZ-binding cell division protein ZapB
MPMSDSHWSKTLALLAIREATRPRTEKRKRKPTRRVLRAGKTRALKDENKKLQTENTQLKHDFKSISAKNEKLQTENIQLKYDFEALWNSVSTSVITRARLRVAWTPEDQWHEDRFMLPYERLSRAK